MSNLPADYDISLYNNGKSLLTTSANASTTAEQIIRNTTSAATYYIKVSGYASAFSASSCYLLRVNTGSAAFRIINENEGSNQITEGNISLYPNPVSDNLTILYTAAKETSSTFQISDQLGRVVVDKTEALQEGENKLSFDVRNLSKGIYFVRMMVNGSFSVQKFIVE